jgi:tripartite-type tricarboxylate transporter receptor subunit TctC
LARQEVAAGLGSYDATLSAMESGVLRPIVVLGATERAAGMPNVPTAAELGLDPLSEIAAPTRIIVGPPDMEPALRDQLVALWRDIVMDPAVVEKFAANKVDLVYLPPEEVQAIIDGAFAKLEGLPALETILGGN